MREYQSRILFICTVHAATTPGGNDPGTVRRSAAVGCRAQPLRTAVRVGCALRSAARVYPRPLVNDHAHPHDPLRGRQVIGIAERIDLPDWGVEHLRVKIDTGARTSALHVDEVEEMSGGYVRFWVVLDRKRAHRRVQVEAPVTRRSRVRSSSGRAEDRIFVSTRMKLGAVEKEIEISLASREPMIFRMLLGRTALHHDFLVDPSHRYLQSPKPVKKKKVAKKKAATKKTATKKKSRKKARKPERR